MPRLIRFDGSFPRGCPNCVILPVVDRKKEKRGLDESTESFRRSTTNRDSFGLSNVSASVCASSNATNTSANVFFGDVPVVEEIEQD